MYEQLVTNRKSWPRLSPSHSHFHTQWLVIGFELGGSLGIANNNGVDGRSHHAEQNTRKNKTHDQADSLNTTSMNESEKEPSLEKRGYNFVISFDLHETSQARAVSEIESSQQVLICSRHGPPDESRQEANAQGHHKEYSIAQIIRDNDRPALVFKELDDVASGFNVTKAIDTDIDVGLKGKKDEITILLLDQSINQSISRYSMRELTHLFKYSMIS